MKDRTRAVEPKTRVHAPSTYADRPTWTRCGLFRANVEVTDDWSKVTCGHCVKRRPNALIA